MADLFAQPQGYGTVSYEARSEFQRERQELATYAVGPLERHCPDCHLIHRLAVPCDD